MDVQHNESLSLRHSPAVDYSVQLPYPKVRAAAEPFCGFQRAAPQLAALLLTKA